ncbi:CRISPR-associated endoribonuclease Cas6 [Bacillus cytotoxicus]|uniref:CRISPR-associated endoribonuclease Cas6 n=1 Tax=Bacillus cytotoxicus TaxID=580165 RepID=UPI0024495FC9|nr:CRISPR-associated endoribonuclease Cas6 [Bacillus cytotoxicus]MDH2881410.1 CRISPR-associated endoribonuclease Cas6 [Bacillus cytotoxicus]
MRLHIKLQTNRFPISYRMMMVSFIKEALKLSDAEYFQQIYQESKANRPFSYGVYIHDYKLNATEFHIKGYVGLTITSPDAQFMLHFYNGLMKMNDFRYKGFSLKRMKVQMVNSADINQNHVYFKTLSPLLIRDKHAKPIFIDDDKFEKELNYISDTVLKEFRGYGLKQPLIFTSKNMKKVVVKEKIHSDHDTLFFTGYHGIFSLQGAVEDLKILSEIGLGFRSSQGFGAVEVV